MLRICSEFDHFLDRFCNSTIEFYCKGVGFELLRFPTRGPLFYRFDSKGSRFSN